MTWTTFENGETIGKKGSERGVIFRDEEHSGGARITVEEGADNAPFSITCGLYGWMFHTRYFSSRRDADAACDQMKEELDAIIHMIPLNNDPRADELCRRVENELSDFVTRFP